MLIFGRWRLEHVLRAYVAHYNRARPHRGLELRTPEPRPDRAPWPSNRPRVRTQRVLGGLIGDMNSYVPDFDPVRGAKSQIRYWRGVWEHTQMTYPARLQWMYRSTEPGGKAVKAAELLHESGLSDFLGKDRANRLVPNRTYIDNAILPAGGTDAPVTPFDPFLTLWSDVTRETKSAGILGPDQAVTPLEALKMHTLWVAAAVGEDDRKGSLEVGKLADMVVLSRDILTCPEEDILKTNVVYTIVGGKVLYTAE